MKKGKPRPQRGRPDRAASSPKPSARDLQVQLKIPPILLEGDEPDIKRPSRSGQEALLASEHLTAAESFKAAKLPEAYSTGQLLLISRDPHSLYAHWDLTSSQLLAYSELSSDQNLVLRVRYGSQDGLIAAELHLAAQARHSFIRVSTAGVSYVAQLGYYDAQKQWVSLSTSE